MTKPKQINKYILKDSTFLFMKIINNFYMINQIERKPYYLQICMCCSCTETKLFLSD